MGENTVRRGWGGGGGVQTNETREIQYSVTAKLIKKTVFSVCGVPKNHKGKILKFSPQSKANCVTA